MLQLKYCKNCLFPETKPDLFFNEEGLCSACQAAEEKDFKIDWIAKEKAFVEIIATYKKKDNETGYDCIIPVSGGKDSTYQCYMAKKYGLNPLAVCFETAFVTELGQRNIDNITKMGIDLIHFKKNYQVYKKMVVESFKRVGDEMWPNHIGIFTIPVLVAVKFGIPLILWGENSQQEYGGPMEASRIPVLNRNWLEEFGGLLGNRIQDMIGVEGITVKELTPYFYPSDEDINRVGVKGIFLGHYFFWDARKQLDIIQEETGFSIKEDGPIEGTYTNYENLDERLVGLHDYLKFVKYGFGRATDHACIDIRNKRLTRDEAKNLVKEYDGKYPHYGINSFVEYSGMNIKEIDKVIDSFTNPVLFAQDENGDFLRDENKNLVRNFEVV